MDYWPIIVSITAILFAIYYYAFKGLNHFRKHEILHIPPIPIFGNMASFLFRRVSITELIQRVYDINSNAKYVGIYDFKEPVLLIRDPEIIKQIAIKHFDQFPNHPNFVGEVYEPFVAKNLFTLRDDRWKSVRTLLAPTFTSSKLKGMFKLMSECGQDFSEYLSTLPEDMSTFDMSGPLSRYTNDVLATCIFGISVNSARDPDNEFYQFTKSASNFQGLQLLKVLLIRNFPKLTFMLGIRIISERSEGFFKDIVERTVKTRLKEGIQRSDMMQLMMDSNKTDGTKLSIEEMAAQAFVFFFGGFEAGTTTKSFAVYELAINPDVQGRLQEEIDGVLEKNGGQFTYEAVCDMEYLDAVINEVLRLYSVGVFFDRECVKSFELPPALPGGKPYTIEKGNLVYFPVTAIHRDAKYYEEPMKFNPDRFLAKDKRPFNSGRYFPFGLGPRMCIAHRFAILDMKVLFCHLLAQCDLKLCSNTKIPMVFSKKTLSMVPEHGCWIKVDPRKKPSMLFKNMKVTTL